jgi:hypothetical protein
MYLACLNLL